MLQAGRRQDTFFQSSPTRSSPVKVRSEELDAPPGLQGYNWKEKNTEIGISLAGQ